MSKIAVISSLLLLFTATIGAKHNFDKADTHKADDDSHCCTKETIIKCITNIIDKCVYDNCSHALATNPPGVYSIRTGPNTVEQLKCCKPVMIGFDMTQPGEKICPGDFKLMTVENKRLCGGKNRSCVAAKYKSNGCNYNEVSGRIIGYQYGTPDAFHDYHRMKRNVDTVDGVLVKQNGKLVWAFAAGTNQQRQTELNCPCNNRASPDLTPRSPYFGNDYFCDSGWSEVDDTTPVVERYFLEDPLWDGAGCVFGSCCTHHGPPWFNKTMSSTTAEDITIEICLDEDVSNENVLIEKVELYLQ